MLQAYVSSVSDVLVVCCIRMDVAKVDRNVAYVAIVVHICCKLLFLMFHLFFPDVCYNCVYLHVAFVSHICCKCFN
jgi:hypothetical protein